MAGHRHHATMETRFSARSCVPSLQWERALWRDGVRAVAGLDEVGRGPLAGPVVAAAVVLPPSVVGARWLGKVRDSKLLTARRREELDAAIRGAAMGVAIGSVSAAELDEIGIVPATHRAMKLALAQLPVPPGHLLIDALSMPEPLPPQTPLIHGDAICVSIACASIVAKVARDRLMVELEACYPGYGFRQNKGYGTSEHLAALQRLGPSPLHRRSFAPVRLVLEALV